MTEPYRTTVIVSLFAVAFAYVEAAVVVYLRAVYYPEGFSLPLKLISPHHLAVELGREAATIVMLAAAGAVAGSTRWRKTAYFLIAFGVWDIFYYVWLKVVLNWPSSLFEWDVLFLIPIPWIGPVLAPVLISTLLIVTGLLILRREEGGPFHVPPAGWILATAGTVVLLVSFMMDLDATLGQQMPEPYRYELLGAGVLCYIVGMIVTFGEKQVSQKK